MTVATKAASQRILAAFAASDLSETSKAQYPRKLQIMAGEGKHPDIWSAIIAHKATIAALLSKFEGRPASQHVYSSAVLAAFKHASVLQGKAPEALAAWRQFSEEAQRPMKQRVSDGQPTEQQKAGFVPYQQICAKRDELDAGSDARLILSAYTLIPARRADLAIVKIFTSQPPESTAGNYLVMPSTGKSILTLQIYKTSKIHGIMTEELPPALVTELQANLRQRPPEARGYMFVAASGLPFKNESAFSKWANSILRRTFHKPTTLLLLRHAYVTALDFNTMTPGERASVAHRMSHGVLMQMSYKFIFRETGV